MSSPVRQMRGYHVVSQMQATKRPGCCDVAVTFATAQTPFIADDGALLGIPLVIQFAGVESSIYLGMFSVCVRSKFRR